MPKVANKKLYDSVKDRADTIYKKPSAYKSGYIVKEYTRLGGKYINDSKEKDLKRWFNEAWTDVSNIFDGFDKEHYPLYRPTIRVNKNTPKTFNEISKKRILEQYKEKQKIKGKKNLNKF